ncbi:uncharacterized protein LOC111876128 isoform X1 [Lactuca sativa]|uniref:Uncharacterized protein n=1 Tax=Lactuca sativa TaxID=4236 RepID=A0A9R1WSD7_LACSA|nr:uncharacterized protein LOC111876128 isoform X1 [Lactuca sativa]KAJ0186531.1 hypothetical protein LSAT_V11C900470700 [Lactuca sativa]
MNYLQNEESFSFKSTSSSKAGLFSDDEEGGVFELSLPPQPSLITKTNDNIHEKEEEFEFCSSLNSSSTLVNFPISTFHHPKPATITSSTTAEIHIENHYHFKYQKKVNNLFNINHGRIIRSPRCHQGQEVTRLRIFDKTQRDSARFSCIRKIMVKLTSIKTILQDTKSRSLQQSPTNKVNKKIPMDNKPNKLGIQRDSSDMVNTNSNKKRNKQEEKSSKSGFNKMFGGFMKNIGICRRSKHVGSKSCPVSIKSSPMHDNDVRDTCDERRNSFYLKDHSIQGAIAHCKKSFGK